MTIHGQFYFIDLFLLARRFPFSQIYLLKTEIEGQSLGIVLNNNTPEIKEIVPGSVAAAAGVSAKVRSIDGQTAVPLVITELNGRPVSLFSKEGECWDRIQNCGRKRLINKLDLTFPFLLPFPLSWPFSPFNPICNIWIDHIAHIANRVSSFSSIILLVHRERHWCNWGWRGQRYPCLPPLFFIQKGLRMAYLKKNSSPPSPLEIYPSGNVRLSI